MKKSILILCYALFTSLGHSQTNFEFNVNDTNAPVVVADTMEVQGVDGVYFQYGLGFGLSLGGIAFTWRAVRLVGHKNHSSRSI